MAITPQNWTKVKEGSEIVKEKIAGVERNLSYSPFLATPPYFAEWLIQG